MTLVLFIEKAVSLKASCVLEDESMVLMGNISILVIRLCVVQNTSNFFLSACFGDLIISLTHFNLIICGEQSNIIKAGMITIFSLSNKNVGRCNILHRVLIKIYGVYYQELNIARFKFIKFFCKTCLRISELFTK